MKQVSKKIYRWAETLAKRKGFFKLKEKDVIKLIKESRSGEAKIKRSRFLRILKKAKDQEPHPLDR